MASTLRQVEASPSTYPSAPAGLSAAAADLPRALVWQRIESWIAWRWTPRSVEWVVEGPGEWVPPLKPVVIETVQVWSGADVWEDAELNPSPLGGYWLPSSGPYRFTAVVGGDAGEVPAAVVEAFRRLAEFFASKPGRPGASSESIQSGSIELSWRRDPEWMAMALQASGAGDLLRQFRLV